MTNAAAPGRIFISYRRDDASASAGRVYDRLEARFGADNVFMDVDSIRPGIDFSESIETAVGSCGVVLVIIGPNWVSVTDEQGRRRLDDPDDLVAQEIRVGLERKIPVIPVLVTGAKMPSRDQLPPFLAPLARRQNIRLDHDSFTADAAKLSDTIERVLNSPLSEPAPSAEEVTANTVERVGLPGDDVPVKPIAEVDDEDASKGIRTRLLNFAISAMVSERYSDALDYFDRVLQLEPKDAYALSRRGNTCMSLGLYEDALSDLDQALGLEPEDTYALACRGSTYMNLKLYDEALSDLDNALLLQPDNAYALGSRGGTYLELGRHDEALHDLDRALRLEPDNIWVLTSRGETYVAAGLYQDALNDFSHVLRLDPGNARVFRSRGGASLAKGHYEAALRDFDWALRLEPDNVYALSNRGVCYVALARYDDAMHDLKRARALDPGDGWVAEQYKRLPLRVRLRLNRI